MYWFILLFPLLIYPWGYDPNYTMPKAVYLTVFVLGNWLYIVIKNKYWSIDLKKPYLNVELLLFIFMSLVGISTIFSVNFKVSLNGFIHRYEGALAYFSYCSIFLLSYRLIHFNQINKLISGMITTSIIVSIYGILQHYLIDFLPRNSSNPGTPRSYGFFDNANFFGSYLVLIMLLGCTVYLNAEEKKKSFFYLTTICLAFISLIFSETRSGWIGVFVGILFISIFIVIKRKKLWVKWSVLIATLMLIAIVINYLENGNFSDRFHSVVTDSYNIASDQGTGYEGSSRLFIWEKSLPLIKNYFWAGSGPDTFAYVFPAKPSDLEKYFGTQDIIVDKAHNEYLQMAITLGVPALITYLIILFFVLKRAFRAVKNAGTNDKIFIKGLISVIIGYLVQAFFNISVIPVAPLFWAILGITLGKSELFLENRKMHNVIDKHNQIA